MKFDYGSDLHISFDKDIDKLIDRFPNNRSDVLILAGDIVEVSILKEKRGVKKKNAEKLFRWISENYKKTYYVFGNHEFYDGELNFAVSNLRKIFQKMGIDNIHILDNETTECDDSIIFGSTMWTSCKNQDPLIIGTVQSGMSDYLYIKQHDPIHKESRTITPHDTIKLNAFFRKRLSDFLELKTNKHKIVVTHHCPSLMSVDPYYRTALVTYAYYDELFDIIYESDLRVWIHGHTHDPSNYLINKTQVLANPRGYLGYETLADDWLINTVDIC